MKTRQKEQTAEKKSGQHRMGIQAKALIGLLGSLIITLCITGVILLERADEAITYLMDKDIASQVSSIKNESESYFENYFSALNLLTDNTNIQQLAVEAEAGGSYFRLEDSNMFGAAANDVQTARSNLPEDVSRLFVAYAGNGQVLKDDRQTTDASFNLEERDWWQQVKQAGGEPIVSSVYEDTEDHGLVVTIAVPIMRGQNIEGAIGADISLENLSKQISQFKVGATGYAVIFDRNGKVAYHPDDSVIGMDVKETTYSQNMKDMISGHQNVNGVVFTRNGEVYHGATQYMDSIDWQVVGCMSDQEFSETMDGFAGTIYLCFGLTALLLAVLIYANVHNVVKPIKKLQKVAEQLADGELDVEVDTSGNDEISDLSRSTSKIVDRLKTYIVYIQEVSDVLEQMGNRNMVYTLEQDYVGEFNKLKVAMNDIQESLSRAMFDMLDSAEQVNGSSSNMSAGAQSLAQGATEQASTVQELAATVQQLTHQAVEEVDKAVVTKEQATEIGEKVQEGNKQMKEMLKAMENISTHSNEIEKIVKTSEDIAFQTNILALNAAVEAARAGAAGKGFAVVADEVRNLASKSAESAKGITDLIQNTILAVNEGVEIANRTALALDEITQKMGAVVDSIDDIVEKYEFETSELKEIATGIDQVSAVVQTNSATAEESAATAEELAAQVERMKEMVSSFQLDEKFRDM